jgi:hypothetical protein
MSTKYVVATYLVDKAYGGPEEGGWWYECGEHVRTHRVFGNEDAANKYCRRLNDLLHVTLNKGRRSISSVLSEGQYAADVYENAAPKFFPETRPYYE